MKAESKKELTIGSPYVPDLEGIRAWLEHMIASASFVRMVGTLLTFITRMTTINTELTKRLADLQRKRPRSETIERVLSQLPLAFFDVGPVPTAKPKQDGRKVKRSRLGRHPGRAFLPDHLPRVDDPNPVPADKRICPECGCEMLTVGHEVCETLEIIPARAFVLRRLDETVACPHDDVIVSAPKPAEIVKRGKLGPTLIVEALCEKYLNHQPVERQCASWARAGVEIAPQTLGRSIVAAIDLLAPVAAHIAERTRDPGLLATDATGIRILDPKAEDGIRSGAMWCWIRGRWVTFHYSPNGDTESVRGFLGKDVIRDVQCDGTSTLSFLERGGAKRPGCWAHGRRGLVSAVRGGDTDALEGVRIIGRLFAVEHAADNAGDTTEERRARRERDSAPVLADLRVWIDARSLQIPPKTPFGKALGYLRRQWKRLVLFLQDGAIELTNNRVERELRRLVLGRKNWLFAWQDVGGERTAIILTIIGTCVAHNVNPRAYLHFVTRRLMMEPDASVAELMPATLAAKHADLRALSAPDHDGIGALTPAA